MPSANVGRISAAPPDARRRTVAEEACGARLERVERVGRRGFAAARAGDGGIREDVARVAVVVRVRPRVVRARRRASRVETATRARIAPARAPVVNITRRRTRLARRSRATDPARRRDAGRGERRHRRAHRRHTRSRARAEE